MSDLNDTELVKLARENLDDNAFNELVERHSGIFVETVSRYCPQNRRNFWMQEILEEKYSVFWDAVSSFSEDKSKFNTWLANLTKYKCKTQRTKENKKVDKDFVEELDFDISNIQDRKSIYNDLEKNEIMSIIESIMPTKFCERDCKIFYERFKNERKLSDIGEEFNLKPQRIEQIGKTILQELKNTIS